mgnify:CR=1 FL=1
MLQRDYILRILQQFYDALHKLVNNIEAEKIEEVQLQFNGMYLDYLKKDSSFFYENDIPTILKFLGEGNDKDSLTKITILAELLYNDALLNQNSEMKQKLLSKTLELLQLIKSKDKTFSTERENRIDQIRELLNKQ